ncbi:MAG: TIGR03016 family PEP-CTERM system-associated outer membrane protein, partial [Burkholderiales bacterium]|nr:TIGR03016 family PEP-CTERM system-associated outer membrane protein [Burkholderiales bacterium]
MGRKIIATMLTLALSGSAWASDWKLGASVTASETYTDNATLGTTGGSKGDFITSVTPTVTAKKDGARLKVDASYSNQNLFYANDSTRNKTYHQLNARANAELFE